MTTSEKARALREDDIRPKALLDEFFRHLKADAERLAARRDEFIDVPCRFCGSADASAAFEKDGFPYAECRACGSLFASPRPDADALADYAANSEAVEFWSTHFYRETAEARREHMFRPRAQRLASLADAHGLGPDATCADIGAGYGLLALELAALNRFGRIIAIEPDARLAEVCRSHGFTVVERWVEELAPGDIDADLACAFEVLEHVFDPLRFLEAAGRLVRPGGFVFFSTLAASGFDIQVLWEHSRSVSPPQHLNFPTVSGVEHLVSRAGLELVEVTTPGRLDVDIVRNRIAASPELPVPRFARTLAAASDATRDAFQRVLAEHRLSSHIQCVARRPE